MQNSLPTGLFLILEHMKNHSAIRNCQDHLWVFFREAGHCLMMNLEEELFSYQCLGNTNRP